MCNDPPVSSRTIPTDPEPSSACLSRTVASPIGPLTLLATRKGLARVCFAGELVGHDTGTRSGHPGLANPGCEEQMNPEAAAILNDTECQLTEYFAQQRRHFDIPLDWSSDTGSSLTPPRPARQRRRSHAQCFHQTGASRVAADRLRATVELWEARHRAGAPGSSTGGGVSLWTQPDPDSRSVPSGSACGWLDG